MYRKKTLLHKENFMLFKPCGKIWIKKFLYTGKNDSKNLTRSLFNITSLVQPLDVWTYEDLKKVQKDSRLSEYWKEKKFLQKSRKKDSHISQEIMYELIIKA